ncbi:DUF11 domain-containing protein [Candidatus Nomurabacteria bacterium]|nr:DUF11 domain-containing protein [Candidatus Nomurabacteria bacterium]
MKGKLIGFAIALLSVATIGIVQLQAEAVDNTRDCDKYAVIYCGTMSPEEARNKYSQGSKIFGAMGISKAAISGDIKHGIVHRDGRITVNGKTVATGAKTAIRNMSGGNKIAGTNAAIYPTSRMADDQTAMVKFDKNGKFLFAIIKPCGNPVNATPVKPPKPEPKPVAKCIDLSVEKLSNTRFKFSAKAEVKNGAKINSYVFGFRDEAGNITNKTVKTGKETASYTYSQTKPGNYSARVTAQTSLGNRTNDACTAQFSVPKPEEKTPSVKVEKLVNNKERDTVKVGENFTYQIKVTNTGEVDLKDVTVTDIPKDNNIILVSANVGTIAHNMWTYKIPQLKIGESQSFTLTAKILKYKAGDMVNNVCVDTPDIPGDPDDCDDVPIDTPKPEEPPKKPGIDVEKLVNDKERDTVKVGENFTYQIKVTNTGEIDLKDAVITDTPKDSNIVLVSAEAGTITDNVWTHKIAELKVGESETFTLTAKILEYKAGDMVNKVCVDTPEVPGNPDDCDEVPVDTPKPGDVEVCDPNTGNIITVPKEDESKYAPIDSEECKEIKVCVVADKTIKVIKKAEFDADIHSTNLADCETKPVVPVKPEPTPPTPAKPEPEAPAELPKTGVADAVMQLAGAVSLAGATAYYLGSRRLF